MVTRAEARRRRIARNPNQFFRGSEGTSVRGPTPKRKISDRGREAFREIDRIRAGTSTLPQSRNNQSTPSGPRFSPSQGNNLSTPSGPTFVQPPFIPPPSNAPPSIRDRILSTLKSTNWFV